MEMNSIGSQIGCQLHSDTKALPYSFLSWSLNSWMTIGTLTDKWFAAKAKQPFASRYQYRPIVAMSYTCMCYVCTQAVDDHDQLWISKWFLPFGKESSHCPLWYTEIWYHHFQSQRVRPKDFSLMVDIYGLFISLKANDLPWITNWGYKNLRTRELVDQESTTVKLMIGNTQHSRQAHWNTRSTHPKTRSAWGKRPRCQRECCSSRKGVPRASDTFLPRCHESNDGQDQLVASDPEGLVFFEMVRWWRHWPRNSVNQQPARFSQFFSWNEIAINNRISVDFS